MREAQPQHKSREEARELLTKKIESERKVLADPHSFSTIDPNYLIQDAEWRLRWIDCAPDGANHQCAPMQDKRGVPCGTAFNENIGPGPALRNARIKRGLDPIDPYRMAERARDLADEASSSGRDAIETEITETATYMGNETGEDADW